MQIIHLVLGKANPKRMNGVNKVAHKLATVQTELAYEVCLWGISNDLLHNYPARNFKTRLFQQHRQKINLDKELLQAINSLSKDTIVHFHGVFIREFSLIAKRLKSQSIPYVVTPHGALAKAAMRRSFLRKKIYFHLFEKRFLQNAQAVQVLGQSGFDHLDYLLPACRKVIIPNGQDLDELPEMNRIANPHIRFVYCGRLDQQHKGLDLLLQGFGKYKKSGGEGRLDFIGDGKDANALKQLVSEEGREESVYFHGVQFGVEKWNLINQGDVFVHTSRMEGFPIAVVEAAGLGLPCIVSEATNIADSIRTNKAGISLSQNTPHRIANALSEMESLHQKGHLSAMGRNARKMILTHFNWTKIAESLVQVYTGTPLEELESITFVDAPILTENAS